MTAEITHHLAAAGRMADVNRIFQVEMIGDGLQIVGIVVPVVSAAGLSRATMSAPISCNDAETFAEEKKHLRVPIIRRERPAVTEHDGLSAAPVFIIDVDVRSVLFSDGHVWHKRFPFSLRYTFRCAGLGRIRPKPYSSQSAAWSRKVSLNFGRQPKTRLRMHASALCHCTWFAYSAASTLLVEVSKNSSTALSSNEGEFV